MVELAKVAVSECACGKWFVVAITRLQLARATNTVNERERK